MRIIVCDVTGRLPLEMRREITQRLRELGRQMPLLVAADIYVSANLDEERNRVPLVEVTLRLHCRRPITVVGVKPSLAAATERALQLARHELEDLAPERKGAVPKAGRLS